MDSLNLILLNIGFSEHYGDWNWKNVNSPFTRIYYVTTGSAKINYSDSCQELQTDHLYLIPPFTSHSYECKEIFSHYYLQTYENHKIKVNIFEDCNFLREIKALDIDLNLVNRLLEINPNRALKQYDPKTYDNQTTLLQNIEIDTSQPDYAFLETKGILSQLVSRFLKEATLKTNVSDERIKKVLKLIQNNINNNLKINTLSSYCNLSEDHFIRLFKKEMQCTPIQYINKKKIEKAQLILATENVSIKELAYKLSFNNISYFNKLFKQTVGMTPSEYCNSLKIN